MSFANLFNKDAKALNNLMTSINPTLTDPTAAGEAMQITINALNAKGAEINRGLSSDARASEVTLLGMAGRLIEILNNGGKDEAAMIQRVAQMQRAPKGTNENAEAILTLARTAIIKLQPEGGLPERIKRDYTDAMAAAKVTPSPTKSAGASR